MFIKKIIIQGFKTYKDTTVIDLISPEFNVVVGRNGSGKSNFFQAIRFVLSDAYTHMTREERQGLIHEGSGTVMSAYVEIIFDNVDRRLPISKDEVSLRRTIGLKKDDYSLDNKTATRSDIMNLLESAGFSRSNPYYIVPQGKITALTNSKDSERLTLLKDVSGAKIFELKLKESLKEMENSNLKRQRIDEALSSINERLSDLQLESDDLKQYQQVDKSRKIFEFNLFDREVTDIENRIRDLELEYHEDLDASQQFLQQLEDEEKQSNEKNEEINGLKTELKVKTIEKSQLDEYLNETLSSVTLKENEFNEKTQEFTLTKSKNRQIQSSIDKYKSLIHDTNENIIQYKPRLNELNEEEKKLKNKLVELSTQQRALYSKQNRFSKFNSKKERDQWLNKEIKRFTKDLNTKEYEMNRLSEKIAEKKNHIKDLDISKDNLTTKLNDYHHLKASQVSELKKSINELKSELNGLSDTRKTYWRDEIKHKSIKDSLVNDVNNATNIVNQTMDRLQVQGLNVIENLVKKLNLEDKVYGPLINLFSVSDKYKTAAEVIAGNSLFHVVVDTDETASMLMEYLIKEKMGRLTFIPLNRITANTYEYPDSTEHQCIPLIKKIKYTNSKITKVIQRVFGRTIVVSELTKGLELSKKYNLNAITLDGDGIESRGSLTGGFRDYKSSRLDAMKLKTRKMADFSRNEEALIDLERKLDQVNQQFTDKNNELTSKLKLLDELESNEIPLKQQLAQITNEIYNNHQDLKILGGNFDSLTTIKQNIVTNLSQLQQELGSEFTNDLSNEEIQHLNDLTSEINGQEDKLNKIVSESSEIESKLTQFESELLINYQPNLTKLTESLSSLDFDVEQANDELSRLKTQLNELNDNISTIVTEIESLNNEISLKQQFLDKSKKSQIKLMKKIEKLSKNLEVNFNKKTIYSNRKSELTKKISDIGILPEEAFDYEKFDGLTNDDLLSKLNLTNKELEKYAHINKKAIEQFDIFNNQRNDLLGRRQDLNESKKSIEKLIDDLKIQKHQAIKKSFDNVASNFTKIFETLVPLGTGKLIMERESQHPDEIDNYTGVSISVSFNSKHDEQQRIEQLSGGQKSLCAITLILSIQNCDPAPFYLFDEIDANLDTQYRKAVATMIKGLSGKAQFICTTFRPEMLMVADKFYGVTFNDRVSNVEEISREDARVFVEGSNPEVQTEVH
ncbi:structural maintenance of chromosomes protein 3 [[Candida] jaroonii]|uniref:Structural maintenance of chromosomes protein 3 n=1 Tax=[Candida] jaroonii TaxID=467808 RepID=A0ACA9YE18_9ASCO|nr:structural maintenance of chromosomes protein 3 [[Candida] jaroonii]